jgi:hypothetical protein
MIILKKNIIFFIETDNRKVKQVLHGAGVAVGQGRI